MTHVKALQAGHSSQGTSEPITPVRNGINHFMHQSANLIYLINEFKELN